MNCGAKVVSGPPTKGWWVLCENTTQNCSNVVLREKPLRKDDLFTLFSRTLLDSRVLYCTAVLQYIATIRVLEYWSTGVLEY